MKKKKEELIKRFKELKIEEVEEKVTKLKLNNRRIE